MAEIQIARPFPFFIENKSMNGLLLVNTDKWIDDIG